MNAHEPLNRQPEPVMSKGSAIITRVAGTGVAGDAGDGGPAAEAQLNTPTGLEVIPGGGFLFSDNGNNVVRQVSPEGVITRVAGTGVAGNTGDGGPATQAQLNGPFGVRVLPGGGFLVADTGNDVVRQVSPEGVITRVAGTGVAGDTGDGGPATQAQLNTPVGIAVLPGGGFLFTDQGNNVVRQVSREGVITRVAGTGVAGNAGDGGPATEARLNGPGAMTVLPGGGFLFSDLGNNVVRQVSREGVITRVAGTGVAGDAGDGGPATRAELNTPSGVAVLPGGGFLVADNGNNVVRQVSPEGVITRVAGTGVAGDTGDGGPATESRLNGPGGVGVLPGGGFLFTDVFNNAVRKVEARQGGPRSM